MLSSTILSKVISKSVPKELVKFFFLAIAPSTESKYPDIQRKTTDKINLSKYRNTELKTPIIRAIILTPFGVNLSFNNVLAPKSIIGFTYFLP